MKATLRIPTNDPFAFIELEKEVNDTEEAVDAYNSAIAHFKPNTGGSGLDTKEFNRALDEFLTTSTLKDGVNLYQQMSREQQAVFQEVKKSIKRIQARQNN
jgi:hypothetical protein